MRVLIACEFSGVVREAFRARGHDAWSCDLIPSEDGSAYHIQDDAIHTIRGRGPWDLLIQHGPCTYLTNAGARWLYSGGRGQVRDGQRWRHMELAARFFRDMMDSDVPMICGENPIPHRYAAAIMGPYTQIIQPYQHGHGETKATCLWLKNLPALQPTSIVTGRVARVHRMAPGPDRWKDRSRTLPGIAAAMASTWGVA